MLFSRGKLGRKGWLLYLHGVLKIVGQKSGAVE